MDVKQKFKVYTDAIRVKNKMMGFWDKYIEAKNKKTRDFYYKEYTKLKKELEKLEKILNSFN